MILRAFKTLNKGTKASLQSIICHNHILPQLQFAAFATTFKRDRAVINDSKKLIINKARLKETSRGNLSQSLEVICNDLVQAETQFYKVTNAFQMLMEKFGHLNFSNSNSVHYIKLFIDKALDVLEKDFTLNNLVDFLAFCDFFKIDDPTVSARLTNMVVNSRRTEFSLEARLELMSKFNFTLPIVKEEELTKISQLETYDRLQFLHLVNVKDEFSKQNVVSKSDIMRLEAETLESVNPKILEKMSGELHTVLVTLLEMNKNKLKRQEISEIKLQEVIETVKQNIKKLSISQLIQIHAAILSRNHSWNHAAQLISQVADQIDEKIDKVNPRDLNTLILSVQHMPKSSFTPPAIQEANKRLLKSIIANVLPNKMKSVELDYNRLSGLLDLCLRLGVWDESISNTFATVITALYEVKRIRSNSYIGLLLKLYKLNKQQVPNLCLSLLKFKANEFIKEASLTMLMALYDILKSQRETVRPYEVNLIEKVSTLIKNDDTQSLLSVSDEKVFAFIAKNMDLFKTPFINMYAAKIKNIIEELSDEKFLKYHSSLINGLAQQDLLNGKAQELLYTFESYIEKNFDKLEESAKQSYIQSMSSFLTKVNRLKEQHDELELLDPSKYASAGDQKGIRIPINVSLLQNYAQNQIQANVSGSKLPNNLNQMFVLSDNITSKKNLESYGQALTSVWEKFKQDDITLYAFSQILRSNQTLRQNFKEQILDKEGEEAENFLIESLCEELERKTGNKTALTVDQNYDPKDRSPNYYIFNMVNFLSSWGIESDLLKTRLKDFIYQNLQSFNLHDTISVLTFGTGMLKEERITLYETVGGRLGSLLANEKPDSTQAYSILMIFHLNRLEEKTLFELERIVAEDFLRFKPQEILKLIEKFEKSGRKSMKMLLNIANYYFKPESIVNLTPLQVKTFATVLLKEKYQEILPVLQYYLVKNQDKVKNIEDVSALLSELTLNLSDNSKSELTGLYKNALSNLLSISNIKVYLHLLSSYANINTLQKDSNLKFSNEELLKKWKSLVSGSGLPVLAETSKVLEYLAENSGLAELRPSLVSIILQDISKRFDSAKVELPMINIFASLENQVSDPKAYAAIIDKSISVYLREVKDFDVMTKFTLLWARSLEGEPDKSVAGEMRKKILDFNPNIIFSGKSVINVLNSIVEIDGKIKGKTQSYYFTRKDYKLLNRLEDTVKMRAQTFSKEELAAVYKIYIENSLGSDRILDFLEGKVL